MAKTKFAKSAATAALLFGGLALVACGGGGGGGGTTPTPIGTSPPPPPPPPPTSQGPTWTQGVFEPSADFINRCETPRTGTDIEGNTFPDVAGSLLEELFWLRSWTNETYLWNDEVTDQDPNGFSNRVTYFNQLRTFATTPSGESRDDFHFSEPTTEFLERRNSTASAGYGIDFVVFSNSVPRDFRVRYTEPNSPASAQSNGITNFVRGTKILEVDGVDLVNVTGTAAVNTLNAGLFPASPGETHTFVVQDPGAATTRTVTVNSANITEQPVNRTTTVDTGTGRVGYILFNTFSPFSSEQDIANAITAMDNQGVTDLVLDLRYNGGGLLTVASQLAYMIAGPTRTSGRTFELLRFNDDAGNTNPVTGEFNGPLPFQSTGVGFSLANGTPLDDLDLNRVFILATEGTCSASEAVINGLRGIDVEIILIASPGGETPVADTCGKPFGFYPQDNCGETYYTIQFQGVNDKGFGDYTDGFIPDNSTASFGVRVDGCVVADDFSKELGDPTEAMFAAALNFRDTQTCPAAPPETSAPVAVASVSSKTSLGAVATTPMTPAEAFVSANRDMTRP